jgi:hypothetical protein
MVTGRCGVRQNTGHSREAAPAPAPDLAPPVPPLGKRGALKLSVEEAASRLARMHAARRTPAERRMEAQRLALAVTGMTLDEARRHIRPREYSVAALHLGGMSLRQIQETLGYSQPGSVRSVLHRPVVERFIQLVRDAQVERLLAGTYGVAAAAKAAAPAVMECVAELAGGRKDRATGARIGRAKRDADAIRAADLVLTTSGDKVARAAHLHLHVLEELTDVELEALAARGEWPERLGPLPAALGECSASDNLPADSLHDGDTAPIAAGLLPGPGPGPGARACARGRPGGMGSQPG